MKSLAVALGILGVMGAWVEHKRRAEADLIQLLMVQYHRSASLTLEVHELCKLLDDKGLHLPMTSCRALSQSVDARGDGLDNEELEAVLHKVVDEPGLDPEVRKIVKSSTYIQSEGYYRDYFLVLFVLLGCGACLYAVAASIAHAEAMAELHRLAGEFAAQSRMHHQKEDHLTSEIKAAKKKGARMVARLRAELADEKVEYQKMRNEFQEKLERLSATLASRTGMLKFFGATTGQGYYHNCKALSAGAEDGVEYSAKHNSALSLRAKDTSVVFGGYDLVQQDVFLYEAESFKNEQNEKNCLGTGKDGCYLCTELPTNGQMGSRKTWALKRYKVPKDGVLPEDLARELCKYAMSKSKTDDKWLVRYERVFECMDYVYVLMENLKLSQPNSMDLMDVLCDVADCPNMTAGDKKRWRSRYLSVFRDVVRAVQYIHKLDVFHNDLKPENVFVLGDWRGSCTIKLIDFGMSRFGALCPGEMCPDVYRPPEHDSFNSPGPDLWRLGQTLQQMMFFLGQRNLPLVKAHAGNSERDQAPDAAKLLKETVNAIEPFVFNKYEDAPHQERKVLEGLLRFQPCERLSPDDVLEMLAKIPDS